ncbi:MAG: DNA/RNA non-specific endonuclease [Candidatus Bipolaricaulaceae bacterium]
MTTFGQRVLVLSCVLVAALSGAASNSQPMRVADYWDATFAGLPRSLAVDDEITVLLNRGFMVGYSDARRNPLWVCYRVFYVEKGVLDTRPSRFSVDVRTKSSVSHDAYTHSGYDRGHMAPNYAIGACYGPVAQRQTFLMSNVCPQNPSLNRGLWAALEQRLAKEYTAAFEEVWVIVGPVFDEDRQLLPAGVEIPDAFFLIVADLLDGVPRFLGLVVPNLAPGGKAVEEFLSSVAEVERLTGLDFFWQLEDALEQELESAVPTALW